MYTKDISLGDLPYQFYDHPTVIKVNNYGYGGWITTGDGNPSSTGWGVATIIRPTTGEDTYYTISLLAIGRWK